MCVLEGREKKQLSSIELLGYQGTVKSRGSDTAVLCAAVIWTNFVSMSCYETLDISIALCARQTTSAMNLSVQSDSQCNLTRKEGGEYLVSEDWFASWKENVGEEIEEIEREGGSARERARADARPSRGTW